MDEKTKIQLKSLHLDLMQHKVIGNQKVISIDYVIQQIENILDKSEVVDNETK